jgi:Spy/CpxP family protein refolding chaperone
MQRLGMRGFVCAAICLAMATTAMAQGQGQGRGGRGGRGGFGGGGFGGGFGLNLSRLVGIEQVQKELKVTDEQKTKLAELRREGRGGGGGGGGNFQNMSEEERAKFFDEMRKQSEERNKKVEAILDADQLKRAKEILLQQQGNGALANPEVAKELALSEDQVAQIKTISEESGKQMRELFRPGADRDEMRKKMEELRKNTDEEYMAVLTEEQKAKFAALKGAKFDLDPAALRGGGGRGREGGRRGGNNAPSA